MHGQKKRRKRFREGLIAVDGLSLFWQLLSEPQWTSEHGYKGLCISIRMETGSHRELILEYPLPDKRNSVGAIQLPQRPKFSEKTIEPDIRQAMAAGWDPTSRGKKFVHRIN